VWQSAAVPRPIEQLRAIARSPKPTQTLNRRTSLILRTDNLLAGKLILPFLGRLLAIVMSSAAGLWKFRAQAERGSGIGLKLFGFIAESVFTFIPESCSGSSLYSPMWGIENKRPELWPPACC
jgi:hypothetical protein